MEDYINAITLKLQPGTVTGPNGEEALLTRGGLGEWKLSHGGRVRWGRQLEIKEDIDHFETHGKLPERSIGGF